MATATRAGAKNEDWREAGRASRAALALNADLEFGQRGAAQAQSRMRLDAEMQALLAGKLDDAQQRRQALAALQAARALGDAVGARMATQRTELERKLLAMSRPVTVVFMSDNTTQVTLLRVAQLGRFERATRELLPGNYTALGRRTGYRDVRRNFTVKPGAAPAPVVVRCEEAI